MNESKTNGRWKYVVIIIIWLLFVGVSFQARSLLTENVEQSTEFVDETTQAGRGLNLYQERFNQTGERVNHIIVIHLPDSLNSTVMDNKWSNFTLYLTLYLNSTMYERGYNQIVSAPLLLMANTPETDAFAQSLISTDGTTTLIYLESTTLDFIEDEHAIEEDVVFLRDLLDDYQGFYNFVQSYEASLPVPQGAIVSTLPTENSYEVAEILLTGSPANFYDSKVTAENTFNDSEIVAVLLIIIVLAMILRSPLGIFLPIITMFSALFPAYLLTFLLSKTGLFAINDFLPSVIAMIGIAVAVDYNLFSIVRYREEFRKRKAKHELDNTWNDETMKETQIESSKIMNKTAGTAVMYSGFTVIVGFSALLITQDEFTIGMAIGVSIVVALSILTARTLTPSILALFGRYLDWPYIMSGAGKEIEKNKEDGNHRTGFWVRWSKLVMNNPIKFILLGLLILAPFVVLSAQIDLSFDMVRSLPDGTESREGFEIIQDQFNLGETNPFRIIIDGGSELNSVLHPDIIEATNKVANDIMSYSSIREKDGTELSFRTVNSLSVIYNYTTGNIETLDFTTVTGLLATVPIGAGYISHASQYLNLERGNNTLVIQATSNLDPGSAAAWDLVEVLRGFVDEHFGSIIGDGEPVNDVYVTGLSALFKDSSDKLFGDVPLMLTFAVIFIFIALTILFRSIILPIKAILTISGSILFALGALVYVFQHGNLLDISVFGYQIWEADQAGVSYFIPVFLFTTILGLGMDYSIFIISRIREEVEKGEKMGDAVGIGLSKTAGVVTSAATIMTITFMVFAVSPMLTLKTMGLAMAIAIVVDATIARIILLPSAMKLAGKYNFWLPGFLKKILPEIELEH